NFKILLRNMVNVLDFEKFEKKIPVYNHNQIIDLSETLSKKLKIFELAALKQGLKIDSEIEKTQIIGIDPFALDRIINNLMDNAIRYNKTSGRISVRLYSDKEERVCLEISDTGIGMSSDQIDKIFEPYHQLSHKKLNIQGIGVGLNIVKKIIDEVGGEITVLSDYGQGSTFTIFFQKLKAENVHPQAGIDFSQPINSFNKVDLKSESYQKDKQTVFIIEDNKDHLAFLQSSLLSHYNVFYSFNGKEALDKIDIMPYPDIIIADIMMDVMDGFQFYNELLKKEKYKSIPIIFLSALSEERTKQAGLSSGAVDFIFKPYSIEELRAKINSILKLKDEQKKRQIQEIENKIISVIERERDHEDTFFIIKQNCRKFGITPRQVQVVSLLVQGLEHKEISDKLNMSINTLKTHIKNIYHKCHVQNKIELINLIKQNRQS
ncbi:MAG: ATP-binding protein, partial [Spirochaetota bacterium]